MKFNVTLERDEDGMWVSVPDHNPVAKGTLRSLIRNADLTVEEFVEEL